MIVTNLFKCLKDFFNFFCTIGILLELIIVKTINTIVLIYTVILSNMKFIG